MSHLLLSLGHNILSQSLTTSFFFDDQVNKTGYEFVVWVFGKSLLVECFKCLISSVDKATCQPSTSYGHVPRANSIKQKSNWLFTSGAWLEGFFSQLSVHCKVLLPFEVIGLLIVVLT